MMKCDIGTHSTYLVLKEIEDKFNISLKDKNVLHIGAHDGLEKDIYDHLGASSTIWVECNPFVFETLTERISGDNKHTAFQKCLWSEVGIEKEYYFYRNKTDGAGGLFKDEKMKDYVKDCPMTGEYIKMFTDTLDNLSYKEKIDCGSINFLNLDVQGSELEVLKGSTKLFGPNLELIYCEVSWEQYYHNGPLLKDIDELLSKFGYNRLGLRVDAPGHGDGIYVRR